MNERNTKQKEIVLEILEHNRMHPTIQELYQIAKEKYPTIGQATIYRNVNKLVEENKVLRLPSNSDEGYHYDINTEPHCHIVCNSCGKIVDLFDNNYEKMIKNLEKDNSITITKSLLVLEGVCSSCKKENKYTN